jgi:RIO kinase 1
LVPEPVGYLIKQKGPFWREAYFFSKAVTGCDNLGTLARDDTRLSDRLDSGGLTEALARAIALLHDSGVTHGDLKWSNILVDQKGNKPWFVDLDAAKLRGCFLGPPHVARDLARFLLSGLEAGMDESIMQRFLDEYAFRRKLSREDIDAPMTRVLRKLKKRHERKLRR